MPSHPANAPAAPPKVSVVIPLYNKQRQIERAVGSIFGQGVQDFEVVIVDDGSTDRSLDMLERSPWAQDARLRIVRQRNAGPGRARNEGARLARAQRLAFLDADDEWLPGHLAGAMAALANAPQCRAYVAAYDTGRFGSVQQNLLSRLVDRAGPWELPAGATPPEMKTAVDACHSSCVLIDRDTFFAAGGYYEKNRCTFGEDAYLMIQLVMGGPIYFQPQPTVLFHVEDSELGAARLGSHPVRPHLIEPAPLRDHCPPARRPQLEALLAYYRLLETEKFSRQGNWRAVMDLRRQFPWPSAPSRDLRMREWKTPLRAFVRGLQQAAFPARSE